MAIQMRRGSYDDLDTTRLKVGEYAVCTNGYIALKINSSQVVRIATNELLEQVLAECADYADDCETYMNNAMYTYFGFSANADGSNMTSEPTSESRYIGIYNGPSSTRPIDYTLYTWVTFVVSLDPEDASFTINTSNGYLYMVTEAYGFAINYNTGYLVISE